MNLPREDLASLVVPRVGSVRGTADPFVPWVLVGPDCAVVEPVASYLADLQASGRSAGTQRSYAMALLRWFRFCWATGVVWDLAGRLDARDFCRWIAVSSKAQASPGTEHPVPRHNEPSAPSTRRRNPVTGKPMPSVHYAPTTALHAETVCRQFYEFHLEGSSGPILNPFPLAGTRRGSRAHAHHNPAEPQRNEPVGRYRPKLASRVPRAIPDDRFDEIFARLPSHRDRALVAFYVSTGARASELLGARRSDVDVGSGLITVVRKGSRALQQLPASPDAFVWLRLYQVQLEGLVAQGPNEALWWTLRPPHHRLAYHGAYRMFARAAGSLGANWTLHDLRHTAAARMAKDPELPLTDVQWVLGHAHLSTTQLYLTPLRDDVVAAVLAHHARTAKRREPASPAPPTQHYREETLDVLFGRRR